MASEAQERAEFIRLEFSKKEGFQAALSLLEHITLHEQERHEIVRIQIMRSLNELLRVCFPNQLTIVAADRKRRLEEQRKNVENAKAAVEIQDYDRARAELESALAKSRELLGRK